MLVNHEQPKVWNTHLLYSGEKQLLNNNLVCHFHSSWIDWSTLPTHTHRNTYSMRQAEWMRRSEERCLKGAALFSPERSPLMGACVIFCMISRIHWQLINLRTIFTRTLMSLMRRTRTKTWLCLLVSRWSGVLYNNSRVRLYLQHLLHKLVLKHPRLVAPR